MTLHIDIFTLFPGMFEGPLTESILKRAQEMGALSIGLHDIRDYTTDRHRTADDTPYGGGGGMVIKVEPLVAAVEAVVPPGEVTFSRSVFGESVPCWAITAAP